MTEKDIKDYVTMLVVATWGFTPHIEIVFPSTGTVQIMLNGTPSERSDLMGKEARNFHALKQLIRIFSRKRGMFSYLYLTPPESEN